MTSWVIASAPKAGERRAAIRSREANWEAKMEARAKGKRGMGDASGTDGIRNGLHKLLPESLTLLMHMQDSSGSDPYARSVSSRAMTNADM
jgi:hypothetical protein